MYGGYAQHKVEKEQTVLIQLRNPGLWELAARKVDTDFAAFLVKAGADRNFGMLIAISNDSVPTARLLLESGASVDAIMPHADDRWCSPRIMEFLLSEAGLDPNAINQWGNSLLCCCVWASGKQEERLKAAEILLAHGAQVNAPNDDNLTPLALAQAKLHGEEREQFTTLLLAHGAKTTPAWTLRILTWNIHHGEGMDGRLDLARIAAVIRAQKPDLVALQEVDHNTTRTGKIDQMSKLVEMTGLDGYFGRASDYAGGEFGNVILSRLPEIKIRKNDPRDLPAQGTESRSCMMEVFFLPGSPKRSFPLWLATTHLEWKSAEIRKKQVERLAKLLPNMPFNRTEKSTRGGGAKPVAIIPAADVPVILAGDFNAEPDDASLAPLLSTPGWTDVTPGAAGKSCPADSPKTKIDHILVRPGDSLKLRVLETRVIDEKIASDHRPVLSVIELSLDMPSPPAR